MTAFGAMVRRLRGDVLAGDAVLAAAILLAYVALLAAGPARFRPVEPWVATLWAVLGVLPVLARRQWLWPAVGATAALILAALIDPDFWQTQELTAVVLAYTAASRHRLPPALAATAALWVPAFVVGWLRAGHDPRDQTLVILVDVVVAAVCVVTGQFNRTRRAYTGALEARAVEAERNQQALAGQAVAEERRRIARELHDVVAHHVSVMGVLATGARRSLTRDPDAAAEALTSIEATGRTTLRELRRLLDVLRTDDEPATPPEAGLAPAPGLTAVGDLVARVRRAGLPVDVRVEGEPYPVDAGIGLAVYRLVQEALTNAVKHAGPARAVVRLGFGPSALTVEVFDTGRGPSGDATGGHGLVGMRERVALYGGEITTGPRPGGGFRVYARIPMDNLEGLSRLPAAEPRGYV
ncbi:sensor histidine kinase [Actinocatenispora rupis]|uniref:histidine kinase n=1 Tax=Actinocatenispora rupis TaxID=519421 RepID=A0A8J3N994_9ACTN|nr:sensor histidine kinase [Actinocatenispora rupis]GID11104.1 two-component sensor histidine kinase [Actinocatenispora rupis]